MTSIAAGRPKAAPEVQRVLQAVWRATGGRPQAWRGLDRLPDAIEPLIDKLT